MEMSLIGNGTLIQLGHPILTLQEGFFHRLSCLLPLLPRSQTQQEARGQQCLLLLSMQICSVLQGIGQGREGYRSGGARGRHPHSMLCVCSSNRPWFEKCDRVLDSIRLEASRKVYTFKKVTYRNKSYFE